MNKQTNNTFHIFNKLINKSLSRKEAKNVKNEKPHLKECYYTSCGGKLYNINGDLVLMDKDNKSKELLECKVFYLKNGRVRLDIVKSRDLII